MSVIFTIDPRAAFSDGTPVTVADVQFSLETLKGEAAHPFYQMYFQDIEGAEILDARRIRFRFARLNRELPMIAGQLPVLSKAFYSADLGAVRAAGLRFDEAFGATGGEDALFTRSLVAAGGIIATEHDN